MSGLKPDITNYSSLFESFGSHSINTVQVSISGTVADLSSTNFTGVVDLDAEEEGDRYDVYVSNVSNGRKTIMNGGQRFGSFENVYQFKGAEVATRIYSQSRDVGNAHLLITLGVQIQNSSGAPIALTSQTLEFSVVSYKAPFDVLV